MKKKRVTLLLFLCALMLLATLPAAAQDDVPPELPPPLPPPIWDTDQLRIEYQRVQVTIDDQVATTHIEQLFVNDGQRMVEGSYFFPLPPGAAPTQLTMWVDGQPIEAKILDAAEARAIYDQIVRQWRDPALLEYVGHDAIQANLFPIPAGDERRVEIEYSHLLTAENGIVRYTYPQTTTLYTNLPLESQSIRVDLSSDVGIRAIYSPSHPVSITRDGEFRATVGYEANDVLPEQDFELYYTVSPADVGLNLLSYKEGDEDGYFLLLVAPTVEAAPEQVVAKDVILVVDTSGSMQGQKMAQAKEAAHFVVDHLNAEDRFNIISFSTGVSQYSPELVPAANATEAHTYIDRMEALGGTNISLALLEALAQADSERPLTLLFLTDGLATEGIVETPLLLNAVAEAAPRSARLFAFGVGDDVDTLLLDSLTANHRGATTYVRPGQAIDEAVGSFYTKVSTPVLTDVTVDYGDIIVEQTYPTEMPDLFAGSQLVIAGRYREGGPTTITLRGQLNGQEQSFIYEDNTFRPSGGPAFIPRLWATRAIGHLLTEIRLHGENPELVQSVVDLSIRHGIITPYTSFLIEEDDILTQSGRAQVAEEALRMAEAPAPVSGADAVEAAVAESALADAESLQPLPAPTAGGQNDSRPAIRTTGSKTFLLQDGVWIDTTFDPSRQQAEAVEFLSDTYFELLEAAPRLGSYLALGPRVIVVYEGIAYEIVEEGGSSSITLPLVNAEDSQTELMTPAAPDVVREPTPVNRASQSEGESPVALLCAPALLLPLFAAGLVLLGDQRQRRRRD